MDSTHFNDMANQWDTPDNVARSRVFGKAVRHLVHPGSAPRIMELGCGTGLLSYQFLDDAKAILGVDTSEGMLAAFDRKGTGHPKVSSRRIDIETQELGHPEPFDVVMSSMAFHHLKTPADVVKKLHGMLAPGGVLAVMDLETEDGTFHPDNAKMGVKHFGFSPVELGGWAAAAGFRAPEISARHVIEKNDRGYPVFLAVFRQA